MKFEITIIMDNAIFAEAPAAECARILGELAEDIQTRAAMGEWPKDTLSGSEIGIRDINGNRCGGAVITLAPFEDEP